MNKGFSLVEILVVVAIAISVVLVVGNFGNNITSLDTLVSSELQAKSSVNTSLQMMTAAIQSASISASGGFPIDSAASGSFAFYSDINKNGLPVHVRYFYATSTIYQGLIQPTGTPALYPTSSEIVTDIIDNVIVPTTTPLFSYYGSSYTGTQAAMGYPVTVSAIRLVGIAFSVQANQTSTIKRSPIEYFSSLVDIRNLDSN